MQKGKKREAPPKVPHVSQASVAAPPAPTETPAKGRKGPPEALPTLSESSSGEIQTGTISVPEELATVWDDEIARLFADLRLQQQEFLIAYLNTGNSAEAYRRAYNPMAKDHLASVAGSRLVASVGIEPILAKFNSYKTEALFTVVHGYREMAQATKPEWVQDEDGTWENVGNTPDWQARKEALIGIRKIHDLDAADKVNHTGKVEQVHSGALTVNVAPLADILNGPASK